MDSNLQIHKTKIPSTFEWLAIVNHAHRHILWYCKIIISSDCWKKLVSIVFLETRRHKKKRFESNENRCTYNKQSKKKTSTNCQRCKRLYSEAESWIYFGNIIHVYTICWERNQKSCTLKCTQAEQKHWRKWRQKKSGNRDTIPMQYLHSYYTVCMDLIFFKRKTVSRSSNNEVMSMSRSAHLFVSFTLPRQSTVLCSVFFVIASPSSSLYSFQCPFNSPLHSIENDISLL